MWKWLTGRRRKGKPQVLYVLRQYPILSESYIKTEIRHVLDDYDVLPVSVQDPKPVDPDHIPYRVMEDPKDIRQLIRRTKPDLLHSHWLVNTHLVYKLALKTGTPFTIRGHSFDTLRRGEKAPHLQHLKEALSHELCLGVLAFPYARPLLESLGVPAEKIVDAPPVIDFELFHDRSPNGRGIMGVGACLPKKKFEDFIDLSLLMPDEEFNLYPVNYETEKIKAYNAERGGHVHIHDPLPLDRMPAEYKKHRWMVYTACKELNTVGWPMAVAESQAAGAGVCMANLRPDLRAYVGECGYFFDDVAELPELLSQPFPEEKREAGFEHARGWDIRRNKHLLTDLWESAL